MPKISPTQVRSSNVGPTKSIHTGLALSSVFIVLDGDFAQATFVQPKSFDAGFFVAELAGSQSIQYFNWKVMQN
jgi:hypothetical protein